jgi:acyl carrier protein
MVAVTSPNRDDVRPTMRSEPAVPKLEDLTAIRAILKQHGRLSANPDTLTEQSDLYFAGLTSLATVNVMLALENHFDVEFPDSMLSRKTFASLEAIAEAVAELRG